MASDGGVNWRVGWPLSASRRVSAHRLDRALGLPVAHRVERVVRVGDEARRRQLRRVADEPGRPGAVRGTGLAGHRAADRPRTLSAVDQPPQLPRAGVSPVGQRAASVAARAASALTTCRQRGLATSRCMPPAVRVRGRCAVPVQDRLHRDRLAVPAVGGDRGVRDPHRPAKMVNLTTLARTARGRPTTASWHQSMCARAIRHRYPCRRGGSHRRPTASLDATTCNRQQTSRFGNGAKHAAMTASRSCYRMVKSSSM